VAPSVGQSELRPGWARQSERLSVQALALERLVQAALAPVSPRQLARGRVELAHRAAQAARVVLALALLQVLP
jgi:hypothetical protein